MSITRSRLPYTNKVIQKEKHIYPQAQLIAAAAFIISNCSYLSGDELNPEDKSALYNGLLFGLNELVKRNKPLVVIEKNNGQLKDFFDLIKQQKVHYPYATYIIKSNGECFQRQQDCRTDIPWQQALEAQLGSLTQQLNQFANSDDMSLVHQLPSKSFLPSQSQSNQKRSTALPHSQPSEAAQSRFKRTLKA